MARAGFGGSGDYSSFFGSLYSASNAEARARQDAADQDAYDKWQSGLMTDDEWMTYMQGRIEAYAGDPKRQEKWVTYLRKYSTVIADNQAEYAYKNGEASISELIGHYQQRLAGLEGESVEARELGLRVNDLLDQRASESIQDGAQALIDQINAGTRSWKDLESFLRSKLGETRANSDLRESLEKQIQNVQETIRSNALEGEFERLQYRYDAGALSARSYASSLRRMAQQFKDSNPKRYYQILQAAVALEKSGGRGGGGGGGRSGAKAINQQIDELQASRNVAQALIEQFESGQTTGLHPVTGKPVVFNEAKVRELDRELLTAFDALAGAYTAKGDKSAAANTQKAKAKFLVDHVVKHNTVAAEDQQRALLVSTASRLEAASEDPDPTRALGTIRGIASDWASFSRGLTNQQIEVPAFRPTDPRLRSEAVGPMTVNGPRRELADQVSPDFVAAADAMANALQTLSTEGLDDASAQAVLDQAGQVLGSDAIKAILQPVLAINGYAQGLGTGEVQRVLIDGRLQYVRTQEVSTSVLLPNGGVQSVRSRVPELPVEIDNQATRLVDTWIDINGTPTKVQAVAMRQSVAGADAWSASSAITLKDGTVIPKGALITEEMKGRIGDDNAFAKLVAQGKVKGTPALTFWEVQVPGSTNQQGKRGPAETWVMDEGTGLWYRDKLPLRGLQTDGYGMLRIDANGAPQANWKSFASASGAPAPYSGTNPQAMQSLLDSGEVDTTGIRGRGLLGEITPEANINLPYYNPAQANLRDVQQSGSWWLQQEREGRAQAAKNDYVAKTQSLRSAAMEQARFDAREGDVSGTAVARLARELGVNIDGVRSRPRDDRLGFERMDARRQATENPLLGAARGQLSAMQRERTTAASGLEEHRSREYGQTYSGPQTVDLGLPKPTGDFSVTVREAPKAAAPRVTPKPVNVNTSTAPRTTTTVRRTRRTAQ